MESEGSFAPKRGIRAGVALLSIWTFKALEMIREKGWRESQGGSWGGGRVGQAKGYAHQRGHSIGKTPEKSLLLTVVATNGF